MIMVWRKIKVSLVLLFFSLSIQMVYALDEEGKQVKLIAQTQTHGEFDITKKRGKFVLIAVWATWCPICLGELPELDTMYKKYHADGLEIIALNIDDDVERVNNYLKKMPLSFPIARRNTKDVVENLDNLGVTPVFYFVGKDGKVIWRRVGPVAAFFIK